MWKSASAMGSDTSSCEPPPPPPPLITVSCMGAGGGAAMSMVLSLSPPPAISVGGSDSTVRSCASSAGALFLNLPLVRVVEDAAVLSPEPPLSCFIQSALMRPALAPLELLPPDLRFLITITTATIARITTSRMMPGRPNSMSMMPPDSAAGCVNCLGADLAFGNGTLVAAGSGRLGAGVAFCFAACAWMLAPELLCTDNGAWLAGCVAAAAGNGKLLDLAGAGLG